MCELVSAKGHADGCVSAAHRKHMVTAENWQMLAVSIDHM